MVDLEQQDSARPRGPAAPGHPAVPGHPAAAGAPPPKSTSAAGSTRTRRPG